MVKNYVINGLMGLCVGDALGVPVEFIGRDKLKDNPVENMMGYGTHGQPAGTWSDDSSLTFCLAESLVNELDYEDIAERFCKWLLQGYWTPFGKTFGVGRTTLKSLMSVQKGIRAIDAGGRSERDNGNGSLMRILPIAFYLNKHDYERRFEITHNISSITHANKRSFVACAIYVQYAIYLIRGFDKVKAYGLMKEEILAYYEKQEYIDEIKHFDRVLCRDISKYNVNEIKSSGYVVDTLEASLWCFLTSNSYKDSVLKAVNLGQDTDTVAAITGGLSGIYYGVDSIPDEWIVKIPRKEDIFKLGFELFNRLEAI